MSQHYIFYLVFLGQVFLISHYLPRRVHERIKTMFEEYPAETHPKLYPGSPEVHRKTIDRFRVFNTLIFVAGLLVLAAMLRIPHDNDVHNAVTIGYLFAQVLPLILLDLSWFRYLKLMRIANTSSTRRAELNPRRLFDFVSPALFGFGVLVYIAFVAFIIYMKRFDHPWFGGYLNIVGITGMNGFFAMLILFNLYGKKLNPHQAPEDRAKQIAAQIKALVITSIVATLFIACDIVLSALDMRDALPVMLSLYLQVIALISFQTYQIDFSNFDVYREDPLIT